MMSKETFTKAISLGVGLAIGLLLIARVCYETEHDRCYKDSDRIYIIHTLSTMGETKKDFGQIPGAVAPGFAMYVPGVETATRTTFLWGNRFRDEDGNLITGGCAVADSCFFEVFDTEILAGDPKNALAHPGALMVSESFALKLGGVEEAIGKRVSNDDLPMYKGVIEGVFKDFPYHSSVKYDVLVSMESMAGSSTHNWVGNDRYTGYVRLAEGVDADMLAPAIRNMQENCSPEVIRMAETTGNDIRFTLYPLSKSYMSRSSVRNTITVLMLVAMLLLLVSLFNYVLIAVSTIVKRSKEMAIRKCYGAAGRNIYGIMAKEALVDMAFSVVVAAVLILVLRPVLEDIIGLPVGALFVKNTYIATAIVILGIFVIGAILPGYMFSKIPAGAAIRQYSENRRVWKLSLLFVQILISSTMLSLVMVMNAQYDKAVNDKPGYEYENLLWSNLVGTDRSLHQGIIDELLTIPGVEDVQMSYTLPLEPSSGNNIFLPDVEYNELFNIADQYESTAGFFDMLGIPFVEGRYPRDSSEVAVSESFVRKMMEYADWSDGAVGKKICMTEHCSSPEYSLTVSGVYKDYRIGTLTAQDPRASIKFWGRTGSDYMMYMLIKVHGVSPELTGKISSVIASRLEGKEIEVNVYGDTMRAAYSDEKKMRNSVLGGCLFVIVIALFGLTGYVRSDSQRRSKEMAIRKVNGASVREIVGIHIFEVTKLSIAALVGGNVAAYFIAGVWLKNFSEKITLGPWYFILADVLVIVLVAVTVVASCLRVATRNPVEYLKSE